jgi:ADP-ribosylglycohydrolase
MHAKPIPDLTPDHAERMSRVLLALDGLSVGDALGQQFFRPGHRSRLVADGFFSPPATWEYTDDTVMALGIYEVLNDFACVQQDELARVFGRRYVANPNRGYGAGAHRILAAIARGDDWRQVAAAEFNGMGSMGNGAAMRVAPIGAYWADDLNTVTEQAARSAAVTHAHPEGIAGAIAVAVGAAVAWQTRDTFRPEAFYDAILAHTPAGDMRRGIEHARLLSPELSVETATTLLGNGLSITAPDTVPFCLWCVCRHPANYADALAATIQGLGDVDTNAAIVGGIVALSSGVTGIPAEWLAAREPLAYDSR